MHCAHTDRCTLITCYPERGRAGIDGADVFPNLLRCVSPGIHKRAEREPVAVGLDW